MKNTTTNQWRHFTLPAKSSSVPVLCFAEDKKYMWAGTYGRGAFKIKKSDFSYTQISPETMPDMKLQHVYAILCDKAGNVWLGGIREKLHKISADGSVKIYPISRMKIGNVSDIIFAHQRCGRKTCSRTVELLSLDKRRGLAVGPCLRTAVPPPSCCCTPCCSTGVRDGSGKPARRLRCTQDSRRR